MWPSFDGTRTESPRGSCPGGIYAARDPEKVLFLGLFRFRLGFVAGALLERSTENVAK